MRTSVNHLKKKKKNQMPTRCPEKFRQDMNTENHSLYERTYAVNTVRWRSQVRLFLRDGKHVLNAK